MRPAAPARWRMVLADGVFLLHTSIVAFFAIGWILPWSWALWTTVVGAVALRVQWWLNDDVCVLTQLERRLRDPEGSGADTGFGGALDAPQPDFITRLASSVFGPSVPDHLVDWITHGVLWTGAGIALLRLIAA